MGYIISNRMVPMILLKILWTNSDREHPISLNQLGKDLMEIFEPTVEYQGKSLGKKIVKIINELNHFFEQIDDYNIEGFSFRIVKVQMRCNQYTNSHCVGYYVNERTFSDAEIRLLCDSILYSLCIERRQAELLFKKLSKMSSKYFAKSYDYLRYLEVVNRTDNEDIFQSIQLICDGIKMSHQISFCYQKKEVRVSPYYLVFCSGCYYLLCNNVGEDGIVQYQVEHISDVRLQNETSQRIETLQGLDETNFNLEHYMKQHPWMTAGELVRVVLLVLREHLETVQSDIVNISLHFFSRMFELCSIL